MSIARSPGMELSVPPWHSRLQVHSMLSLREFGEAPLQFPVVRGNIRRALLRGFPYGVFFTVHADTVQVLAVVHLHRHP